MSKNHLDCLISLIFLSLAIFSISDCLNNGLGTKPILGWKTGSRYPCLVDCFNYPNDCISEKLVRIMADILALNSFSQAGYQYIIIGDCWMDSQRDQKGRLMADRTRFPSGMYNLVSYVHSKQLMLGLQIDLGTTTCGGMPGSQGSYDLDAQTMANWNIDLVTASACGISDYSLINKVYPQFGKSLNQTKVPIFYACDWPVILQTKGGGLPNYTLVAETCNSFKIYSQTVQTWEILNSILNYYSGYNYLFKNNTGPGSFADLDALSIGGQTLSSYQEEFAMVMWATFSSPIFVSTDLQIIASASKRLLLNEQILFVSQNPIISPPVQTYTNQETYIWTRNIMPNGSYAVAVFNKNVVGLPSQTSVQLYTIGVYGSESYNVTEVISMQSYGIYKPWHYINFQIEPCGASLFIFIANIY